MICSGLAFLVSLPYQIDESQFSIQIDDKQL